MHKDINKRRKYYRDYSRNRRNLRKQNAVADKGGKCQRCGYSGTALTFHHRDPSQKHLQMDQSSWGYSQGKYEAELAKCDLLCANCHLELEIALKALQVKQSAFNR